MAGQLADVLLRRRRRCRTHVSCHDPILLWVNSAEARRPRGSLRGAHLAVDSPLGLVVPSPADHKAGARIAEDHIRHLYAAAGLRRGCHGPASDPQADAQPGRAERAPYVHASRLRGVHLSALQWTSVRCSAGIC